MGLNVFVLTGAGISAESGLGAFRDASGIWTQYDLSKVATPEGFARDPAKVRAFDERRYGPATEVVPAWVEEVLAR